VVEGVIRPVRDDDGDIVSLLVSGRDITEATEQNRELERYEAIVENSEDGIYVFDDQGRFKFVNQRVTDVSGIRHRDWVDEPVSILQLTSAHLQNAKSLQSRTESTLSLAVRRSKSPSS